MDTLKAGPKRVGTGRIAGLQIIDRRVEELKPDPNNPRRHSKKQVRQIAASIEAFGFNVPILIDREGQGDRRSWKVGIGRQMKLDCWRH